MRFSVGVSVLLMLISLEVCLAAEDEGKRRIKRASDRIRREDGSLIGGVRTSYFQPEQIHLSYGVSPYEMMVTWVTMDDTFESVVVYGTSRLDRKSYGTRHKYVDGGSEHRVLYIHRVRLENLTDTQTYLYHCGSELGWSAIYFFRTPVPEELWSPVLAVYGDLGNVNGQSIPRLQNEVQQGMYDAILHVGDFAYDMYDDNARVGDEFFRQIETIAAYVPYQACPGNHEHVYNFSNYNNRFSMVSQRENVISNHYYSFNIGPAHVISFSTEFYFFIQYGMSQIQYQYDWLEKDLQEANKPENREKRPWIITMAHRPMYCSNNDTDDCTKVDSFIRKGFAGQWALETLFFRYGVDLEFWAHEHSYERTFPIFDYKVYPGSENEPYVNPGAPVHITTGSAGCQEEHDFYKHETAAWSATTHQDYGYSRLYLLNKTHLCLQQVSDDKNGEIIDEMWLVQENHSIRALPEQDL